MASLTMTASFLGGANISQRPSITRRSLVVAKATGSEGQDAAKANCGDNGRRVMVFAAAAAAICAAGSGNVIAMAGEGPKRGTPEAKKIYAPVCVTMPTARICHK